MIDQERRRAGVAVAAGLGVPVATTVVYMLTLGGPDERGSAVYFTERWDHIVTVWLTETIGFAIAIVAALGLAAQPGSERASWNAIALGSLGGLLSTAIGIGMFQGFSTAGEEYLPLFSAVLTGSFFFFFLGKATTALGVLGLGVELLRRGTGLGKGIGVLAILTGLSAAAVNLVAMASGLSLVFPAGITGTIAAAIGVIAALRLTGSPAPSAKEVA